MIEREAIHAFAGKRVVVVGDLMLDVYLAGEVRRISPEAPVPVVEVADNSARPGGAANTALNLAALGAEPLLLGVVGADYEGERLLSLLSAARIETRFVVRDELRPTTSKTRIVARSQQIVRIDREIRTPVSPAIEAELLGAIEEATPNADACILSDYQKGVLSARLCTQAIAAARKAGRPIVVDPKGNDFSRYCGCTVVTPNTHELEGAVGRAADTDGALVEAGSWLLDRLEGAAVLVTRGAAGMTLLRRGCEPRHISTAAQRVYDVTGAGDTVVSTLALGLSVGLPLELAMDLANRAAGVAVSKPGASTVSPEELLHAVTGIS